MNAKKLILSLLCATICTLATAQKPMIEVSNDKKKINVHELGFSESMTLNDVLHMLPELLSRPSEWQYENYSVEVNGIEVGDARDAVLDQLRLSDIQYIEVSENPITSYQNNGEGGTISIELANLEEDGKVKGSVSLIGGYQSDFSPNLNIGYKKNKFSIKALAIAEFFSPNNITKNIDNKTTNEHKSNSTDSKFATETALVHMTYNPTVNNELKLSLEENWKKDNNRTLEKTTKPGMGTSTLQFDEEKKLTNLFARLEYNHYFGSESKPKSEKSMLKFETTMTYKPAKESSEYDVLSLNDDNRSKNIAGKLEYSLPIAKQVRADKMDFKIGTNFKLDNTNSSSNLDVLGMAQLNSILDTKELTTFLAPYFQTEYIKDKISFKGIFEYQYFKYDVVCNNQHQFIHIDDTNKELQASNKSFTGKLMVGYRFAPNQTIRLIADRKIKRPTNSQIYPYLVLSPKDLAFIKGNPDLKPLLSNEITIDYITEVDNETHSVMMNIGLSYIHVDDVIVKSKEQLPTVFKDPFDEYYTFFNSGSNHIAKTNFMMFYKKKIFSILFTTNVFNNIGSQDYTSSNHYTYFNSMISPSFRFKYGWHFSVSMAYNSKVIKSNETLGDNLFSGITISKNFNKFIINAYAQVSLLDNTKDYSYVNDNEITTTYNAIANMYGIGLRYQF